MGQQLELPETATAPSTEQTATDGRKRRGFASMDPARVRAIASMGGRAAHAAGTAHQFTSDEARVAGKKGGTAPHVRRGRGRRARSPRWRSPRAWR